MTATARGEGGPGLRVGRLPLRARGRDAVVEVQHHRCRRERCHCQVGLNDASRPMHSCGNTAAGENGVTVRSAQTTRVGPCIPVGTRL